MAAGEQRNIYKGFPSRSWIRIQLIDVRGATAELQCIADTGNPFAVIVDDATMERFRVWHGPGAETNFGRLSGGRLTVAIPELDFIAEVPAYANDNVSETVKASSPHFSGLVGLPLLRMLQYGGDSECFWIRRNGPT